MSVRKEQAIYDAVHEAIMQLRIWLQRHPEMSAKSAKIDTAVAQAGHAAGMAASAAYRKPLKRKTR